MDTTDTDPCHDQRGVADPCLRAAAARRAGRHTCAEPLEDYGRALRAWHVAWLARVEWHARTFRDLDGAAESVVYQWALDEHDRLQAAEQRAYDRFLNKRATLEQVLRSDGQESGTHPSE